MQTTNSRWYEEPRNDAHAILVGVFRTIRDEAAWRIDADEYHAGLYCATDRQGIRGASRRGYTYGPATLPYNVCRAATDTLLSKTAQHRPLPQVLTQRGSWKNQKRARKMTEFLEGEFYRQRFFESLWAPFIRDALIFGRGALKIWTEGDKVRTERAHPWELFVDDFDARYGEPRNLYQVRSIDRGVALQLFAKTEGGGWKSRVREAILTAGVLEVGDDAWSREGSTVDRVDVIEAWHLPSAPGADDGRHVIAVQGATLVDEPWKLDYFPFVVLSYNAALEGFWGHGLVEQIEGYQYEINQASEKSSEQHRMSGVGVLVPDGAGIHDTELRNGITIMRHKPGGQPSVFQMDLVNEHTRQRPRELTQDALNDSGLSQMSVQSQKPAGIQSGIALQTLDDVESQRFMVFGRACEAACVEAARRYIDCAKQIAAEYGDMKVSVPMKGGMLELSWNDVYVDGVEIRVFPTSLLPQQLSARLEKLKDLWNTGLVDRATFLRHLDAPDMQAELDLETADRLVVDEMIERMLDAEEEEGDEAYFAPSAYQDLQWAAKRCQQKLNRAMLDGADEYNMDLLRRFIKHAGELMKAAAPPAPPVGAPGLAPPPGASAPPPDLPGIGIPGSAPPMAA